MFDYAPFDNNDNNDDDKHSFFAFNFLFCSFESLDFGLKFLLLLILLLCLKNVRKNTLSPKPPSTSDTTTTATRERKKIEEKHVKNRATKESACVSKGETNDDCVFM